LLLIEYIDEIHLERCLKIAFYDIDLTEHVTGKYELWEIKKMVNVSELAYRLKYLEIELGPHV